MPKGTNLRHKFSSKKKKKHSDPKPKPPKKRTFCRASRVTGQHFLLGLPRQYMHQFGHNYRNVFGLEPGPTTTTSGSFHASSPAAAAQFSNLSGEQQQQQQQQLYDSPSLFQFDSFENNTPSSSSPDPRVFLFSPEQLARHVSSDASSFTSSSPASPLMGGNNNFCAGNGGSSSSFYSLQGNNSNYSTPNSPVFSQFQDVSGGGGVGSPYSTSIDANSPRTVSEEFQSESYVSSPFSTDSRDRLKS